MRVITGPAGSGKTEFVLDRLREAARDGDRSVCLLVPTATMAQHLQNRLAREGLLLRTDLIQTLNAFVGAWSEDVRQVSETALYLIVEESLRRVARPEFAAVAEMPGFAASVVRTIGEFSSAGCDSARLARSLPEAPLAEAFLAVFADVDRELGQRGLAMRGRRLEHAAERIAAEGTRGVRTVLLDGFHELPEPELRVLQALGRHAEVILTFEEMDARLRAAGFREDRRERSRPAAAMQVVCAPNVEREADEIARRILEQATAGRPFREMGVVVRARENYVPILQTTFERFGIPARFYFEPPLVEHSAIRFLSGVVDAMLSGWDHQRTVGVLKLAPAFADSGAMDRLEFEARESMPDTGLGALKAMVHSDGVDGLIDEIGAIEEWRSLTLAPADWAGRLGTLRALYRPSVERRASRDTALLHRSEAIAVEAFAEAMSEAAEGLDGSRQMGLEEFWRAAKAVLRLKKLFVPDRRRNVVHVLSAHEARQWVLPVVFVCGLVEKQFPQAHRADPFFPEEARCCLNDAGIHVRTAAAFERQERALFDSAVSRGTMLVTLSYPEFDARGERNLASIYLEDVLAPRQESVAVRPRRAGVEPREGVQPLTGIIATALLNALGERTARMSPTALESYLQCPFQYFGTRLLRLHAAPARPEERLDFIAQGEIVHAVLAEWWNRGDDIAPLFEIEFAHACREKRIPRGYHTERLHNAMLQDLEAFASDNRWPREVFRSETEKEFAFAIDGIEIGGKIDRLDVTPDGRTWVIDYKYSAAQRTKARTSDQNLLQAPLYLLAAQRAFGLQPAGMFYAGLKGEVVYAGWSADTIGDLKFEPLADGWLEEAEERTLRVVAEIRAGHLAPAPADSGKCRLCDCRDVCRVTSTQAEGKVEGA